MPSHISSLQGPEEQEIVANITRGHESFHHFPSYSVESFPHADQESCLSAHHGVSDILNIVFPEKLQ